MICKEKRISLFAPKGGRRFKGIQYLFALLCVILCGCGKGQETQPERTPDPSVGRVFDYNSKEWKAYSQVEAADPLWTLTDYLELDNKPKTIDAFPKADVRFGGAFVASEGSVFYCLEAYAANLSTQEYVIESAAWEYYLTRVDTDADSLETKTVRLDFSCDIPEAEDIRRLTEEKDCAELPALTGLDVVDGKACVFFQQFDPEAADMTHCYAAWMDGEGKCERILDLAPALSGLDTFHGDVVMPNPVCDREGRYYVRNAEMTVAAVVGGDGELEGTISIPQDIRGMLSNTCKLPDGRPVFEYTDGEGQNCLLCFDGKTQRTLYRGENLSASARFADENGNLYWYGGRGLLCWDVAEGRCRKLYGNAGVNYTACEAVVKNGGRKVSLFCMDWQQPFVVRLEEEPDMETREVRIFSIGGFLSDEVAEYNRKHPGVNIVIDEPGMDMESSMTRAVSEILSGKGADLFMMSMRRWLPALQGSGALADLSEYLPEEIRGQIFEGALAGGVIDGKLYGIPTRVELSTMIVSRKVWDGDGWTIQDVMRLMEETEGLERVAAENGSLTPDMLLSFLCSASPESSPFLDMERRTCSFDTEEFRTLLRFCKKYGEAQGSRERSPGYDEQIEEMRQGKALMYRFYGGLIDFSNVMEALGEDYACVGYPSTGGTGNFVTGYNYLAVNSQTENMDIVIDFLRFVLSEKKQIQYNIYASARKDVYLDNVKDHLGEKDLNGRTSQASILGIKLGTKKNGSSYLEEFMMLMDTGQPESVEDMIGQIIYEEAQPYFAGDKDEYAVSKIIQNRVQLYLDEGN